MFSSVRGKVLTSNDILSFSCILSSFRQLLKCFVFIIKYSNFPKGASYTGKDMLMIQICISTQAEQTTLCKNLIVSMSKLSRLTNQTFQFLDQIMKNFRKQCLENKQTDLCLNGNSCSPFQWKSGPLKHLVKISTLVYSSQYVFGKELDHLRTLFIKINDYPAKTVKT